MSNIYQFDASQRHCPVGSLATHRDYGWCQIISAEGLLRGIEYEIREPEIDPDLTTLDDGTLSEELLLSEIITRHEAIVDVRELRPATMDQLPERHGVKLALLRPYPDHSAPSDG